MVTVHVKMATFSSLHLSSEVVVAETTTEQKPMQKKRSWFSKWFLRLISAIVLLFFVAAIYTFGSRYIASRRAQNLLSTISESGLPTTREEARRYYESLQTEPNLSNDWMNVFQSFEESNLEADREELTKHGRLFPSLFDGDTPDLAEDVDRLEAFTSKHSALIEQVRTTARKSGYVDLFNYDKATFSPEMRQLRRAVFLLACDAVVAIERGDVERFQESVEGILQIAQLTGNAPLLGGQLVRFAVIGPGCNVVHHALSRLQLPLETSERLASKLHELDLFDSFRRGLVGERALMAECFRDLQLWEYADRLTAWSKFYVELNAPADLCFYLEQLQIMIDALDKTPQEAFQIADSITQIEDRERVPPISATLVPAFRAFMVPIMRTTFHADACRTGLAIENYRAKNHQIPKSLDDLVPEFLDNVPIDNLDGKPLRFETTAKGYRIYSVGHNGKDGEGPGSLYRFGPKLVIEVPRTRDLIERQREAHERELQHFR